jgi:hypothetical protein
MGVRGGDLNEFSICDSSAFALRRQWGLVHR